jgi:hypothetical protein
LCNLRAKWIKGTIWKILALRKELKLANREHQGACKKMTAHYSEQQRIGGRDPRLYWRGPDKPLGQPCLFVDSDNGGDNGGGVLEELMVVMMLWR